MYDWIRRQFFSDSIDLLTKSNKKKFKIHQEITVNDDPFFGGDPFSNNPNHYTLESQFNLKISAKTLAKYTPAAMQAIMSSGNPPPYFWLIALKMKEEDEKTPLQEHARKLAGVWKEFHTQCEEAFLDPDIFYDTELYRTMLIARANENLSRASLKSYLSQIPSLLITVPNLFDLELKNFEDKLKSPKEHSANNPFEEKFKDRLLHIAGELPLNQKKQQTFHQTKKMGIQELNKTQLILKYMPDKTHAFITEAIQANIQDRSVLELFDDIFYPMHDVNQFLNEFEKANYIESCALLSSIELPRILTNAQQNDPALFAQSYRTHFDSLADHFERVLRKGQLTLETSQEALRTLIERMQWDLEQREQQKHFKLFLQWLGIAWMRQDLELWTKDMRDLTRSNPGYVFGWLSLYIGLTAFFIYFPVIDEMFYPLLDYIHEHDFKIENYHVNGNNFESMLENMDEKLPYSSLIVIKPITMVIEGTVRKAADNTWNITHQVVKDISLDDLKKVLNQAKTKKASSNISRSALNSQSIDSQAAAAPQSMVIAATSILETSEPPDEPDEFTISEGHDIVAPNEETCKAAEAARAARVMQLVSNAAVKLKKRLPKSDMTTPPGPPSSTTNANKKAEEPEPPDEDSAMPTSANTHNKGSASSNAGPLMSSSSTAALVLQGQPRSPRTWAENTATRFKEGLSNFLHRKAQ